MIQANELRVGNWVSAIANKQQQITAINPPYCSVTTQSWDSFHISNLTPIPLTPEILEKCGFVKGLDTFGLKNWFINYLGFALSNAPDDVENPNDWYLKQDIDKPQYITFVKSLHQLQNLYFALTGEELTYTP